MITVASLAALTAIVNTVLYNLNMKRVNEYSAVVNPDAVLPVLEDNGEYAFITDRELKIVTLTDVHIGGGWMSFNKDRMAFNTVASLVTCEKPDLVVITGDLAYPYRSNPAHLTINFRQNLLLLLWKISAFPTP